MRRVMDRFDVLSEESLRDCHTALPPIAISCGVVLATVLGSLGPANAEPTLHSRAAPETSSLLFQVQPCITF